MKQYWILFWSTFQLSAFTFGGGYVIVPLMRKRFVEGLGWFAEEEMMDMVAIAQSAPGPIAVNTSIMIGYRIAGVRGAVCTILGTILPPLLILSLVSLIYTTFQDNPIVRNAMRGMQAGIAAIICDVVWSMTQKLPKEQMNYLILGGAFFAVTVLQIHVVIILLACAMFGAIRYKWRKQK